MTPISEDVEHSAVLFLAPESDEVLLHDVAQRAVEDVKSPEIRDLRAVPVTACLESADALFDAVRTLCRCPVAVFALGPQMGRQNPGGMLLMGIRAAVRRGATIVVHEGSLDAADWNALPFNLKELHVYCVDAARRLDSAALVGDGIREGLAMLSSDAQGYRDMPVFDIVRRPLRRTPKPAAGEREVFVLCSFQKSYDESWQTLQLWLNGKDDGMNGKLSLKRVLDYASPLLVAERLYELTRHAGTCLIDWTGWSPNVFFEMGVRLAVATSRPVCVMRHGEEPPDEGARRLLDLFDPLVYRRPGKNEKEFLAAFLNRAGDLPQNDDTIYAVAERNTTLDDEYGGRPLHEQLFTAVQTMLGPDLANLMLLYCRNLGLRRQVLQSAADSLLAARLLIEHKRAAAAAAGGDEPLAEMNEQIESLLAEVDELLREMA